MINNRIILDPVERSEIKPIAWKNFFLAISSLALLPYLGFHLFISARNMDFFMQKKNMILTGLLLESILVYTSYKQINKMKDIYSRLKRKYMDHLTDHQLLNYLPLYNQGLIPPSPEAIK